jgi:hypothetical protein
MASSARKPNAASMNGAARFSAYGLKFLRNDYRPSVMREGLFLFRTEVELSGGLPSHFEYFSVLGLAFPAPQVYAPV